MMERKRMMEVGGEKKVAATVSVLSEAFVIVHLGDQPKPLLNNKA